MYGVFVVFDILLYLSLKNKFIRKILLKFSFSVFFSVTKPVLSMMTFLKGDFTDNNSLGTIFLLTYYTPSAREHFLNIFNYFPTLFTNYKRN